MTEDKECSICYESLGNHYISSDYFAYLYIENADILLIMSHYV